MGGSGSTRWGWHSRKTQVEECHKLTIYFLKPYLYPLRNGGVTWRIGEREAGSISYRIRGNETPEVIWLAYTIGKNSGNPVDYDYPVRLTTSALPWGGVRYWFTCPAVGCGRRVGCLYLPSGGKYFACRHCYHLAYESSQESHTSFALYDFIAAEMQNNYPGITRKDAKALLDDKTTPHMRQLQMERYYRLWQEYQQYDPYSGYLSVNDFCEQSGLNSHDLSLLESARLLLPDTKDGRYRPKLAGWGRKLAYLINEGWTMDEIKAWAKGRWKSPNPRHWPPEKRLFLAEL
jgi:hypothetical protein